jgi:MOSC domain-containing protein YiiM
LVGEAVLEITAETKPCQVMEAAHHGLRSALKPDWRGGVCCRVISGGKIRIGDPVELL